VAVISECSEISEKRNELVASQLVFIAPIPLNHPIFPLRHGPVRALVRFLRRRSARLNSSYAGANECALR
jgi:hypothetical protein